MAPRRRKPVGRKQPRLALYMPLRSRLSVLWPWCAPMWVMSVVLLTYLFAGSRFSYWASFALVLSTVANLVGIVRLHNVAERERRAFVLSGRCFNCGYDLRSSPDRCPECGTEPVVRKARSTS